MGFGACERMTTSQALVWLRAESVRFVLVGHNALVGGVAVPFARCE